jgi:hypothetical protein
LKKSFPAITTGAQFSFTYGTAYLDSGRGGVIPPPAIGEIGFDVNGIDSGAIHDRGVTGKARYSIILEEDAIAEVILYIIAVFNW